MKICTVCHIDKPLSEFPKGKGYHNGIRSSCKICHNANNKRFRDSDKGKQYYKDKVSFWQKSNPEKMRVKRKRYRSNPINKMKEKEYKRKQLLSSPGFKIECAARCRVREILRINRISHSNSELIGCSRNELITHLSALFKPGMTLQNHGVHGWHVDHVIPCAKFDLTNADQLKQCFHYTNLQPLWCNENWKKGSKVLIETQNEITKG
jgi:hypothetical protein